MFEARENPPPVSATVASGAATVPGGLVRAVSRWELVGMAINDVVGSGVYLLPAAAAATLGGMSVGGWILTGAAVMLLVLCFAEAASHFDEPGGAYLYTREAFGGFVGFEVGWMTWLARVSSVAALSNGLALAVGRFWPPAAGAGWERALVVTLPLALLTWINVVGVKAGARAAVIFTIGKILPLLVFIAAGLFVVDGSAFRFEVPPQKALGEAGLLLLFAYAGFENTPAAAGEYRNPRRDVPFALLLMIVTVTLLYTLVQVVALGTFPGLAQSKSPLADAAGRFLGGPGLLLMSLGAVISIAGNMGSTTLTGPRYLFALAKDGYGPRALARVHPIHRTPAAAILTQSALALALAFSGTFEMLAMLSAMARLVTYAGTAAAVPVLRKRFGHRPGAVRLPLGPAIPLAAVALSILFIWSAKPEHLIAGGIALTAGAGIYAFGRWRRPLEPPAAR